MRSKQIVIANKYVNKVFRISAVVAMQSTAIGKELDMMRFKGTDLCQLCVGLFLYRTSKPSEYSDCQRSLSGDNCSRKKIFLSLIVIMAS